MARHFSPGSPGAVAAPWLGLNRYGWGGERLQVSRLDVPDSMLDAPMTLVAGEAGAYTLLDRNGTPLVDGKVGQTAQAGDVTMTVSQLQANPGMRFKVTRLNSLVILDQLKQDISASEQGRDSGVITLTYSNPDPLLAKRVLQEVSNAYVRQNVARNSAEAAKRLEFVKAQLPKVRK